MNLFFFVLAYQKTETYSVNVSDDSPVGTLSATELPQLTDLVSFFYF